MRLKYSKRL